MTDLTLTDARNERDRLAARTDVLDRVGVLRTLPDELHVTTPMVAEFYGVTTEVIRQLVLRNREEFDDDGYVVMKPSEVSDKMSLTPSELGFPNGTSQVALFPRRAVLRAGMLLRDSDVARQVRDYLLDAERPAPVESDDELIHRALEASARRIESLRAQVAELEPKAEVASKILDAEGDLSVKDTAQSLTRAGIKVGQNRLFTVLERSYHWISRAADGRYRVKQSAVETGYMSVLPQSHYHPRTGVLVLDPPQPRVTPKGLQRLLNDHTKNGTLL